MFFGEDDLPLDEIVLEEKLERLREDVSKNQGGAILTYRNILVGAMN